MRDDMKDITGQKFGRLTAVRFSHWKRYSPRNRRAYWEFVCECGNQKIADSTQVKFGSIHSCGCLQAEVRSRVHTKHGDGTPGRANFFLYKIWQGMKDRCEQPSNPNYAGWGARGIKILWESYEQFRHDMLPSYVPGLTIERKDNNGHYCKDNCIWIPRGKQAQNRRDTVFLEFEGERKCLSEWARIKGMSVGVLWHRLNKMGWPLKAALTTPPNSSNRLINVLQLQRCPPTRSSGI